jgi:hypothetical protein
VNVAERKNSPLSTHGYRESRIPDFITGRERLDSLLQSLTIVAMSTATARRMMRLGYSKDERRVVGGFLSVLLWQRHELNRQTKLLREVKNLLAKRQNITIQRKP